MEGISLQIPEYCGKLCSEQQINISFKENNQNYYPFYTFYTFSIFFSSFYINRSRQKYSLATSVLGDSFPPPAETHAKWENKLERDFQISNHHQISQ